MRNQRPPTRSPYARWSRSDTVPSVALILRRGVLSERKLLSNV